MLYVLQRNSGVWEGEYLQESMYISKVLGTALQFTSKKKAASFLKSNGVAIRLSYRITSVNPKEMFISRLAHK